MNSNKGSWCGRKTLLVAAWPLLAVGAFASTGTAGEPTVRVMTVSYGYTAGKCDVTYSDTTKKANQSDQDTVLLRLDNRCRENVDVKITASTIVFSCEGQPSTAVLNKQFALAARSKAYLDCTLNYANAVGGDFDIVVKSRERGSELALEAVP